METRQPLANDHFQPSLVKRRQRGFTMMEVVFSMIIFLMAIMVFGAVFPFTVLASRYSANYQQAAMLAQHKIDELRQVQYIGFYNSGGVMVLPLVQDAVVDSCSTSGSTTTCGFTNIDNLVNNGSNVGFFPPGSTGTITIAPDPLAPNDTTTGLPNALNVTVTVTWTSAGAPAGEFTTAAKFINMQHQ